MRFAIGTLIAILALPSVVAAQSMTCRSLDGQIRADFGAGGLTGITLRVPAGGKQEVRTLRLGPADVILDVQADGDERVVTEGCMGVPRGTIAVIKQTSYRGRRIRLSFPGGGAFPAGVVGRTADGDAIERDLNCTWSKSGMATCP